MSQSAPLAAKGHFPSELNPSPVLFPAAEPECVAVTTTAAAADAAAAGSVAFTSPTSIPAALSISAANTAGLHGTSVDASSTSTTDAMDTRHHPHDGSLGQPRYPSDINDIGGLVSSQSIPLTVTNSQESHITSSSGHAITPPASDISSVTDGGIAGPGAPGLSSTGTEHSPDMPGKSDHLMHLSTIAAAQNRMAAAASVGGYRKRMADGEVKKPGEHMSPAKRHSRNVSTVSMASTTGSTIGELSAELKTRLSYAMVKVNYGWQTRSIEEVESLASQAVSPSSSSSTIHRRHGSSASPRLAATTASAQVHFAQDATGYRRKSDSPPHLLSNKPTLAPPATIQPLSMPAPRSNLRRNSSPRYNPVMLSHSHSASPHTPAQPPKVDTRYALPNGTRMADPILFPSHQNVREQDAIESLLFMSSPNNSASIKHTFSPSGSPGPQVDASLRSSTARHALPSGPRKGLPSCRPSPAQKRAAFDKSPGMFPPSGSPMDVDSPQHSYYSPNRATPKRRIKGTTNHLRGALSLPTGLGIGHNGTRRVLRDEDIERMLDRAGAEVADSSDDEEIQLPRARSGVMGVRS